jgi:hypothetical protein
MISPNGKMGLFLWDLADHYGLLEQQSNTTLPAFLLGLACLISSNETFRSWCDFAQTCLLIQSMDFLSVHLNFLFNL